MSAASENNGITDHKSALTSGLGPLTSAIVTIAGFAWGVILIVAFFATLAVCELGELFFRNPIPEGAPVV